MKKLEELRFDNSYARLGEAYFSRVRPTPAVGAHLVAFNPDAAALLELDPGEASRPEFVEVFGGQRLLPGLDPVAMVYAGHQFGVRVPRLGDGRALLLGQALGAGGQRWDLHLKGSGQTPYSRQGDGRAVLRSCIREYLCGEAMHGLGIPSTRSLCIIGSPEPVYRETIETRAQLVRMAPSHVRFGSFEYFFFLHAHEPEVRRERLAKLADHVITEHFPALRKEHPVGPERYGAWLREVSVRTARLIARWQAVGWAHGVMNTDNLSILGITLDYGPFGFMDDFDFGFIPNHSDESGRYAFSEQPRVGLWSLNVLARSLLPLMSESLAGAALEAYEPAFHEELGRLLRSKLGLRESREEDAELVRGFYGALLKGRADHTRGFRLLGAPDEDSRWLELFEPGEGREAARAWLERYRARLRSEGSGPEQDAERARRMRQVNPKFVLRNYLAQRAIDEALQGRFGEIERLRQLLRDPFAEHPGAEADAARPPEWGKRLEVSCSS